MPRLLTGRLTIVPCTAALLRAASRDPVGVGRLLDVRIPAGWPNADEAEILPTLADGLDRDPSLLDWGMHLFLHTADRALVGAGGLQGRPDETGAVEIGYGIAPEHQGHGYATEGAWALIAWAFGQPEVRRVIAGVAADNSASIRVLEKIGMERVAPSAGAPHWELRREAWAATEER